MKAPSESRRRRQRVVVGFSLLLLTAVTILPIWVVKYPPLLDYPNHLARSYVLSHLHDASQPFDEWYEPDWGMYPYLGMDVLLRALQWIAPIELAGRLFLTLVLVTMPLSTWFFLCQANPTQDSIALWALVATHNIFFLLGYLNFYLSLTFCFLGLGLWLKWGSDPRLLRWILAAVAFTALYFSHLIAFGIAGLTVTAYCLLARQPVRHLLLSWAMFLPGACCYVYSARIIEKQSGSLIFLELADKFRNLRGIMHGYSRALDGITLLAFALYFIAAWFKNPEFRWNWKWLGVGTALFGAYWLLPWAYGDGADLDVRILPVLLGVILASAHVGRRGWRLAPMVLALFFLRVGNITQNYRHVQPELEGLARSFTDTPMNARVLPIIQADPDTDALQHPFAHFWAYGVIRRHWFSAYLFELRGLMPLRIREQAYTLDGFWDLDYKETPDWEAIREDYDYVWCYNAPQFTPGLARIGRVVYADGKLKMYFIPRAENAHSP